MTLVRSAVLLVGSLLLAGPAFAQNDIQECPVGLVTGKTLDEEFGPGTQEATRCITHRNNVKVVIQVNNFCRDAVANSACTRAYALGNILNMIKDYEITYGMEAGKDFEIVAVVHSGGGALMLQDGYTFYDQQKGAMVTVSNQFQALVQQLLDKGVRFYFCQNTTRGMVKKGALPEVGEGANGGGATEALIPGVEYTTAGVSALADLQRMGYTYVQP